MNEQSVQKGFKGVLGLSRGRGSLSYICIFKNYNNTHFTQCSVSQFPVLHVSIVNYNCFLLCLCVNYISLMVFLHMNYTRQFNAKSLQWHHYTAPPQLRLPSSRHLSDKMNLQWAAHMFHNASVVCAHWKSNALCIRSRMLKDKRWISSPISLRRKFLHGWRESITHTGRTANRTKCTLKSFPVAGS